MASTQPAENAANSKRPLWKKAGIVLLVLALIVVGFFLGIYLKIFDSDAMNQKMGLYNLPVIGQYFVPPTPDKESSVPDDRAQKAAEAQKKKEAEQSKPVKLTKEEVDKLTKQRQAEEKKRVSKLARLYNEMKPADAARILETMDNDIVIAIFQRMDESQVSQIMTEFDAGRAASISKIMYVGAPKRVQQIAGDALGTAGVQQQ